MDGHADEAQKAGDDQRGNQAVPDNVPGFFIVSRADAVRHLHGKACRKRVAHAVHQPCARCNKTDGGGCIRSEPSYHRRVDVLHGDRRDLCKDRGQAQPPDLL